MRVKILKPFPYAAEGTKSVMLSPGDESDIRDEFIAGLEEAGLIDTGGRQPGGDMADHPLFAALRNAEEAIGARDAEIELLNAEVTRLGDALKTAEANAAPAGYAEKLQAAEADLEASKLAAAEAAQREAALTVRIAALEAAASPPAGEGEKKAVKAKA